MTNPSPTAGRAALLVIDAQYDYLRDTASGDVIARLSTLVDQCRADGIPVVHVWTTVRRSTLHSGRGARPPEDCPPSLWNLSLRDGSKRRKRDTI